MKHRTIFKWMLLSSVLLLMSFTALHKFYLSVSELSYSESDQNFRMTTRVFVDDLDAVLKARYDIDAQLTTEFEHEMADYYLEKYIRAKLLIKVNDQNLKYSILGRKVDNDQLIFFIEIPYESMNQLDSLFIQNEILMDLYEEQQNVVHLQLKGKKKSLMLIRERPSAVLNF